MSRIACVACQGTGVGYGQGGAPVGQLLPLCLACNGAGAVSVGRTLATEPFRAIWLVGTAYVVRLTAPRTRGVVVLDIEWSPKMPPSRGKKKLQARELRQYTDGRTQALHMLNLEVGGTFELVQAGERH